MTYFLFLMMPRYCRAEKHIPKSISVYIKVFGMDVELNIFTEKIKTGKSYLAVKRLSVEKKLLYFRKILYVGLENYKTSGIYFIPLSIDCCPGQNLTGPNSFVPVTAQTNFRFMLVPSSGLAQR